MSTDPAGVIMDDNYGMIQIVMTPGVQAPFREWLASRGLYLFQIPLEDDLPTYGIGAVEPVFSAAANPAKTGGSGGVYG